MMSPDIRVRASKRYRQLFLDMASILVGGEQHEVFFLCACIGFQEGNSVDLDSPDDRFWSRTITPDEWTSYYAMVLHDRGMDYSAVGDDREVLRQIEKWAMGGIQKLLDDLLCDYTTGSDESMHLDSSPQVREALPALLLQYLADVADACGQ